MLGCFFKAILLFSSYLCRSVSPFTSMWSKLRGTDDSNYSVWLAAGIRIAHILRLHQIKDESELTPGTPVWQRELGARVLPRRT
jgi:hypothetical protein